MKHWVTTKMNNKLTKVQFLLIAVLTIFYFSYMLVPNQNPTDQVRGEYYGAYVWPVGIWLYRVLGPLGWSVFGIGMTLWFWYSLPLYILLQGILQIQIPFTATPSLTGEYPLAWWGWMVMFGVVILYNFLIAYSLPYLKHSVRFFFRGAKVVSFKDEDAVYSGMPKNVKTRGFEER